ncbi:MAG: glycosyl transferase family 2 [Frankiales bacterium]|nr:glycosyl transferase family 2 [Frankiales bacterium]
MVDLNKVGVVIVSYASEPTIAATLTALPLGRLGGVVVVDNASPDASAEVARRCGVVVLEQDNLGFGAGNNRGAAELGTELVLFLNPDAVLQREDLECLVAYLDAHPACAVVGPRVLCGGRPTYSAGRLTSLAGELRPLLPDPLSRLGPKRRLPPEHALSGAVGYVEGACFLIRRAVLAELGGFDEGYFLYGEELELGQRLARLGWEVHLCADAVVEHAMGVSTRALGQGAGLHLARSQVRYLRRWHGERAARTWARAARLSWALRARTGRLSQDDAHALRSAVAEALSHPPPPPAGL